MSSRTSLSQLVLPGNPTASGEAATKNYVDTTTIPLSARGASNGVAPLNSGLLVPIAHLPMAGPTDYPAAVGDFNDPGTSTLLARNDHTHNGVPTAAKGAANGVATLDGSTKIPIAQIPTGTSSSTVAIGNDSRLSDARTPLTHTHAESDVTNLTTDLTARQLTSEKNQANGYAGLNGSSKLTASQQVYAVVGNIVAVGDTAAAGTSDTAARGDHVHPGVALTGDQTIAGIKTFSSSPIVPTPTTSTQAATKAYADLMVPLTQRAAASGVATLDSGTKIPIAQLPTGTSSTTVVIGDDTRLGSARHIVGGKRRTSSASATSGTTELQVLDTGSLNLEASSSYLIHAWLNWTPSVVNDDFDVRIRSTNVSGTTRNETVAPRALGLYPYGYAIEYVHTTTTAENSVVFVATIARIVGSGTATVTAGSFITVQYVGTSSLLGTL